MLGQIPCNMSNYTQRSVMPNSAANYCTQSIYNVYGGEYNLQPTYSAYTPQYYMPYPYYQTGCYPNISQQFNYTKLENKVINGKTYNQYQLLNGTKILICPNLSTSQIQIKTSLKQNNNLFTNDTEKHIFEHMFCTVMPESQGFNCGGRINSIDDGDGNQVCVNSVCGNGENLLTTINEQAKIIYGAKFSEDIFNREKQALNVELATKSAGFGKRSEIDDLSLNHLRFVRNLTVKPQNIEIMVEGNINPDELILNIANSNANTNLYSIAQLPPNANPQKINTSKGKISLVSMQTKIEKPQYMNEQKFQAALEALRLLALFSNETNLTQNARTLCYGPNIEIKKSNNLYSFTYTNETFDDKEKDLRQIYIANFEKIKSKKFTEKDLDNAKRYIQNSPNYMLSSNLNNNGDKQRIIEEFNNLSLDDLNTVIDSMQLV